MSDSLRALGAQMANVMFNLAQGGNLPPDTCDLLRDLRRQWDEAVSATPAPQKLLVATAPCPCTLIEQDEDCHVGYPSLLCGICDGKGHTTQEQVTALACEMIKIASDVGGPEDPFAAWESISLIQSQHDQMRLVIEEVWKNGLVIESSVRRGDGPDQYRGVVKALQMVKETRAAIASTEGAEG